MDGRTKVIDSPTCISLRVDFFEAQRSETTATCISSSNHQYHPPIDYLTPSKLTFQHRYISLTETISRQSTVSQEGAIATFRPIPWIWSATPLIPFGNFCGSATGAPLASRAGACQPNLLIGFMDGMDWWSLQSSMLTSDVIENEI